MGRGLGPGSWSRDGGSSLHQAVTGPAGIPLSLSFLSRPDPARPVRRPSFQDGSEAISSRKPPTVPLTQYCPLSPKALRWSPGTRRSHSQDTSVQGTPDQPGFPLSSQASLSKCLQSFPFSARSPPLAGCHPDLLLGPAAGIFFTFVILKLCHASQLSGPLTGRAG